MTEYPGGQAHTLAADSRAGKVSIVGTGKGSGGVGVVNMNMQIQGVVSAGVPPALAPDLSEEEEDAVCGAAGAGGRDFISLRKRKKLNTIVPNPRKPRTADYMCANCGEVCTVLHGTS